MVEYHFEKVEKVKGFGVDPGAAFEKVKEKINDYAKEGWRLVQVVTPHNEKMGVDVPLEYQIIFEREL